MGVLVFFGVGGLQKRGRFFQDPPGLQPLDLSGRRNGKTRSAEGGERDKDG